MPSLRELQRSFGADLMSDQAAAAAFIIANGLEPAARLQIYRNNARENFVAALRAAYPVLERLVGEDFFRQVAREYRLRFPSHAGNLHAIGERLAEFLVARFAGTQWSYFADVARLEWALQESLVAADAQPFDLARLAHVDPASYARLVFVLHPAVRLVSSSFPVLTIWNANQSGARGENTIDLDAGGEDVLVLRTDEGIELRRLPAADFAFLTSIGAGATLEAAVAAAGRAGAFDVATRLHHCVASGVLSDFRLARVPRPGRGAEPYALSDTRTGDFT